MRIVTVYITRTTLHVIDNEMCGEGTDYPSRSEFIREAVRDYLMDNYDSTMQTINEFVIKGKVQSGKSKRKDEYKELEGVDIVTKIKDRIENGVINRYVRK
jgi:Arc/MetJ-type ribon-helix-helix transcriptional regulator